MFRIVILILHSLGNLITRLSRMLLNLVIISNLSELVTILQLLLRFSLKWSLKLLPRFKVDTSKVRDLLILM